MYHLKYLLLNHQAILRIGPANNYKVLFNIKKTKMLRAKFLGLPH